MVIHFLSPLSTVKYVQFRFLANFCSKKQQIVPDKMAMIPDCVLLKVAIFPDSRPPRLAMFPDCVPAKVAICSFVSTGNVATFWSLQSGSFATFRGPQFFNFQKNTIAIFSGTCV